MSDDRIAEIRARLDAAKLEVVNGLLFGRLEQAAAMEFITNAPEDMLYLLDEVERLRAEDAH